MSAFLLVIPWLAVRHIVPALAEDDGAARAAHVAFGEKDGMVRAVYNLLSVAVVLLPLVLTIRAEGALLAGGAVLYIFGIALEARAALDFCRPGPCGFVESGLFRISRNPMYVSYLLVLLGIAVLAMSPVMLALALGFQTVSHLLVLAEERWCLACFGDSYAAYMERVRRYL